MRKMIIDEGTPNLIAWKCEQEDFDFGTQLVVHESQQAVFFRDGQALEVLGPGMHILETSNFPFLKRLINGILGRKNFHCEIYFVNHAVSMSMPWGTRERASVIVEVEAGHKLPLSVGAGGTMNLQADPEQVQKLLTYLVGTNKALTKDNIQEIFMSMMNASVKPYLASCIQANNYNIFSLDQYLGEIGSELHTRIAPELEKYGIILREFYLERIVLPEDDPAFQKARLIWEQNYSKNRTLDIDLELDTKKVRHSSDMAKIKGEQTLTEATAEAQASIIKAQAEAERRRLEGITSIQEHQFETINNMVEKGGSGVSGGAGDMTGMFSDVMKMGVGIQLMKEAGGVMKDAMDVSKTASSAVLESTANTPVTAPAAGQTWKCACGYENIANNKFCGECGSPKPAEKKAWKCVCGHENPAESKFCGECGTARPAEDWKCTCGTVNPAGSKFCGECGAKKA